MNPLGDTLVILSLICFGFALACFIADEVMPRLFRKRDERWTEYEHRCGVNESCILRENHAGPHEEKEYD